MQQPKNDPNAPVSKTNPEKVKQEIQKDVNAGQGDITAREAGGLKHKK
ncbi:hypothetical protein SAMN04488134_107158 [Amphibacillus marinus]|uniref:Uncharacterized protein n=1 Tax=Amphibacillus marinus TaxID=872970 RepID=A0A1H8PRW5_9BACI|nr:hypothetical protein [Amphibacillus marinus]SEO44448.1 hypothetical protein SAMN04488134_107158 [Amphibacillus marinus]